MKKYKILFFYVMSASLLFFTFVPGFARAAFPDGAKQQDILQKMSGLEIPFIENRGQVDKKVRFYARTFNGTLFVDNQGVLTYCLPKERGGVVIKEHVTEKVLKIKGQDRSSSKISFFKGKDKTKWQKDIPSYNRISLGEVYNNIELDLAAYGRNVEKLFIINQGGRAENIKVNVEGAKNLSVSEKGELQIHTDAGLVSATKPFAYQEINGQKVMVAAEYKLYDFQSKNLTENNPKAQINAPKLEYGFQVGNYDRSIPLIIDPLLAGTFLGGAEDDRAYAVSVSGNRVYVAGYSASEDFPATSGAYDDIGDNATISDVFVAKFNMDLTDLKACTYLGGSDSDEAVSMIVDSGSVFVVGYTNSFDFPTTNGVFSNTHNSGGSEVFVSRLSSDLDDLQASTFIGGSSYEDGNAIAADENSIFVAGYTASDDFPTRIGAYIESDNSSSYINGRSMTTSEMVFISRFDKDLSTLEAGTFLGGSLNNKGYGLALDDSSVYVTGYTNSPDFPTVSGAYETEFDNASSSVFVSRLDKGLTTLQASTFLGGNDGERAYSIVVGGNSVYVTGYTESSDFPVSVDGYDTSYNGGSEGGDVFISRFNKSLTVLEAGTFLGGSNDETGQALLTDGNCVFVSGKTRSADFPSTSGAYTEGLNGSSPDVFVSILDSSLTTLSAGTFIGGTESEGAYSLAVDGDNVYVTGYAYSTDYPVTVGAWDENYNGGGDVFVSKLDLDPQEVCDGVDNDCDGEIDEGGVCWEPSVSPAIITFGDNRTSEEVLISNTGTGTMIWTAAADVNWISFAEDNGTTTTETDTLTVLCDRTGLDVGRYTGTITITAGEQTSEVEVLMFVVNASPTVVITLPAEGERFTVNSEIRFFAAVTDDFDNDTGISVQWTSDVDGVIGTGLSIAVSGLTIGPHTITAAATDSGGMTGTASVKITVGGCPIGAALGAKDARLGIFRQFRDERLSKNVIGRTFISAYYCAGPGITRIIEKSVFVRRGVKALAEASVPLVERLLK